MSILSSTKTGKTAVLIPETKEELIEMIKNEIQEKGWNCNLNHIKTHKITSMSLLFSSLGCGFNKFNGDISKWDVSNVTDMYAMFYNSFFNGDISKWKTEKVTDMGNMFGFSYFNGDISKWNVSNVKDMHDMFAYTDFDRDISSWNINSKCNIKDMFYDCLIKDEYKPKNNN